MIENFKILDDNLKLIKILNKIFQYIQILRENSEFKKITKEKFLLDYLNIIDLMKDSYI